MCFSKEERVKHEEPPCFRAVHGLVRAAFLRSAASERHIPQREGKRRELKEEEGK